MCRNSRKPRLKTPPNAVRRAKNSRTGPSPSACYPPGAYLGDIRGSADLSIGEVTFRRTTVDNPNAGDEVPLADIGPVTISEVLYQLASITKKAVPT